MADPISVASLALSFASKTTEALTALRERAQRSKDIDIKEQINTLYDNVLQLKDALLRLMDENKHLSDENEELRRQLEQQRHPPEEPRIRQFGETNYYYKGEEGPFCQPCYDVDPKAKRLVALSPQETTPWGSVNRNCPVCHQTFYEKKVDQPSSAGPRYIGGGSGGWMR
jgi:hypothetical protein